MKDKRVEDIAAIIENAKPHLGQTSKRGLSDLLKEVRRLREENKGLKERLESTTATANRVVKSGPHLDYYIAKSSSGKLELRGARLPSQPSELYRKERARIEASPRFKEWGDSWLLREWPSKSDNQQKEEAE